MVVRGPRFSLRLLVPADAPALFELGRDPDVSRFFSWGPYRSPDEALEFVASLDRQREAGERLELGIFGPAAGSGPGSGSGPVPGSGPAPGSGLAPRPQLVGVTGLSEFSRRDRRAVLGTWLGRPFWGSGANRESKALVLALAFRSLGLMRVTALASPQNVRSVAALQRLGFVHEGVLRGWHIHGGVARDVAVLRMLREEWERTPLAEVDVTVEGEPPPQFAVSPPRAD